MAKNNLSVDIEDKGGKKVRAIKREKSHAEVQQDVAKKIAELEARVQALESKTK